MKPSSWVTADSSVQFMRRSELLAGSDDLVVAGEGLVHVVVGDDPSIVASTALVWSLQAGCSIGSGGRGHLDAAAEGVGA